MAGLSSNWKQLQAKLKAESESQPSLKRKAGDANNSSSPKVKKQKKAIPQKTRTVSESLLNRQKNRKMGGVQSSVQKEDRQYGKSPSLALWAADNGISPETLAEAYDLGSRDNSMIASAQKDKINYGLTKNIEVGKFIAIDCEMVGVGQGGYESVLARVSVVDFHGTQVYDSYVQPRERVTDWRTSVSGISRKEMRFAREFKEVQKDVADLLQGRILIGHDIKHDLDALMLGHPARDIRDTSKYHGFKKYGNGRKPALRVLAQELLNVEIQSGAHSSIEDARVTMLLFRKHKSGFDVDNATRFAPTTMTTSNPLPGKKTRKKRK